MDGFPRSPRSTSDRGPGFSSSDVLLTIGPRTEPRRWTRADYSEQGDCAAVLMMFPSSATPLSTADIALLAFGNGVELAARDLYSVAAGLAAFSDEERAVLVGFHDHHRAAAQALAGLIGSDAPNVREDAVYNAVRSRLDGSNKSAIYDALRELENTLVASHTTLVGTLDSTGGSALVASIITTQARHAAILALVAGRSLNDALVNSSTALTPGAN